MGLTLLTLTGLAVVSVSNWSTRHHLATMLKIASLPQSVKEIDCASFGVTDVLERCSFELAPADFPKLLAGYKFQVPQVCGPDQIGLCVDKADAGMSHAYCCGPKTGQNFHIATTYIATPDDAPHGGSLKILSDKSKQKVMVELYIE